MNDIVSLPWQVIQARCPQDVPRGLYSPRTTCSVCGDCDFCFLLVLVEGLKLGPSIVPMCLHCIRQLPDERDIENQIEWHKTGQTEWVTTWSSNSKDWGVRE